MPHSSNPSDTMRPVSVGFPINQPFGSMKTAGVVGDISRPNTVEYYVAKYGNYQPYGHACADFKCPEGTPVHAIAAGTVLWADWGTKLPGDETNAGYRKRWYLYKGFPGIVTVIQHAGWIGVYAHLSAAPLNIGDNVAEGQVIGLSGGTGGVAPHLHVEALVDLTYKTFGGLIYGRTDPEPFFGPAGIAAMGATTTAPLEENDVGTVEGFTDKAMENLAVMVHTAVKEQLSDVVKSVAFQEKFSVAMLEKIAAQSGVTIDTDAIAADIRAKLAEQIGG